MSASLFPHMIYSLITALTEHFHIYRNDCKGSGALNKVTLQRFPWKEVTLKTVQFKLDVFPDTSSINDTFLVR